jgi:uncharacterized protein
VNARPLEDPLPGMAAYVVGFLEKSPSPAAERAPETEALMAEHLAHLRSLVVAGDLVAAGPFADNGTLRGLFLFAATADEAKALAAEDPMVKIGRLSLDLHPWMANQGVIPAVVRSP